MKVRAVRRAKRKLKRKRVHRRDVVEEIEIAAAKREVELAREQRVYASSKNITGLNHLHTIQLQTKNSV